MNARGASRDRAAPDLSTAWIPRALVLALVLVVAPGLSCRDPGGLPAISNPPTGEHHVGEFVWHDLLTDDVDGAKQFYGGLFGWTFEQSDREIYTTVMQEGVPVAGVIYVEDVEQEFDVSRWMAALSVEDVDEAVRFSMSRGAVVHVEAKDVADRGRVAVISDPQGAVVSFVRSSSGDPVVGEVGAGDWLWNELWTTDVSRAIEFYSGLVGYESERVDAYEGIDYYVMRGDTVPRGGIGPISWEGVRPHWLPYIAVDDLDDMLSRVEGLGGKILIKPEHVRGGTVAVIADPSGAAFSIQQWPLAPESSEL